MSENDRVVEMIGGIVRGMKYTLVVNRGFVRGTWDLRLYQDGDPLRVRAQVAGSLYAALCYLRERCECEGFGEDIDWGVEGNTDGQGQTGTNTDGDDPRMIQEEQKERLWDEVSGGIPANSVRLGMSHVSEARAAELERIAAYENREVPPEQVGLSDEEHREYAWLAGKDQWPWCFRRRMELGEKQGMGRDIGLGDVVRLKPWTVEDEMCFQVMWQRREKLSGKGRVES